MPILTARLSDSERDSMIINIGILLNALADKMINMGIPLNQSGFDAYQFNRNIVAEVHNREAARRGNE